MTTPSKPITRPTPSSTIMHDLDEASTVSNKKSKPAAVAVIIILLGIASGFGLTKFNTVKTVGNVIQKATNNVSEAGIEDSQEFKDESEGLLEKNDGSVTWEGTHKLIREGGPAQTAYLTSSVIDLSKFEGKKVKIKGRTFAGEKAGWLMDVGWIKVVE